MRNKREMLYEAYWAIKPSRSERKSKKKSKTGTAGKRNNKNELHARKIFVQINMRVLCRVKG